MQVTIEETVYDRISREPGYWVLYGRSVDEGDVVQITLVLKPGDNQKDSWLQRLGTAYSTANIGGGEISQKRIDADFILETAGELFWVRQKDKWSLVDVEIVRTKAEFFKRTAGILDSDILKGKSVAIIGLGTGGSLLALEMARAGVGHMILVDFDRLETHNIARHVCGLKDIGRLKTRAVADLARDKSPYLTIESYEIDVIKEQEQAREIIAQADLVLVATDSEGSKILINRLTLAEKTPAIYGGAYERGIGGDVIRVIPGETPCYDCVIGQVVEELGQPQGGVIDYSLTQDPSEVKAQPGLGIDVSFIALIQAKVALWTLLEMEGEEVPKLEGNYILWGNSTEWIFERPFQSVIARTERNEACPTCSQTDRADVRKRARFLSEIAGAGQPMGQKKSWS